MVTKRKTHAQLGCSCLHLEGLTQQKKKKLLDAIWANTKREAIDSPTAPGIVTTSGLQCVACGRLSADADAHRAAHPGKRLPAGHELTLDLASNEVFCITCADYVYCPDIDRAVTALLSAQRPTPAAAADAAADAAEPMDRDPPAAAALHVDLTTEEATKVEEKGSDGSGPSNAPPPPVFRPLPPSDAFPPGLRGLNNMGHTCFMNSILQALIHAPLLPEHHLAQGHLRGQCPLSADGDACVACEMDRVFSEAFSGERSPHSPAAFLHAWWTLAGGDLGGGCKQQDAHEFFLFVLEMLVAVTGRNSVIARLFEGTLRSDVWCECCGAVSATSDHFTHLSLDIPPPTRLLPPPILPRPSGGAGNGRAANAAAAAGAKANRQLVGAAKAAHLARLNRQQPGRVGEPTPEPSSQAFADGATATLTIDESAASEAAGIEASGATATSGGTTRPSPPPAGFHDARLAEPQAEQASGIDAGGAAVMGTAADTLSSPRRAAVEEPPRDSTSPSTDVATNPTAATAAAATAPGGGTAAAATVGGQLAHPALAGYLHWPGESLLGCLRRFVWPERLGAARGWRCPGCGAGGAGVKQLTLARLPPILVMHAKRFEHSGGPRAAAKKLDTYLSFPLEGLDMAPFLTAAALRARHVARPTPPPGPPAASSKAGTGPKSPGRSGAATLRRTRSLAAPAETKDRSAAGGGARSTAMTRSASAAAAIGRDTAAARAPADGDASAAPSAAAPPSSTDARSSPPSSLYDLFAVVCHRGTFQGGHYVAYIRAAGDGRWYLCDDAYVAPVLEETVRTSQAYMLFYGQRDLLPWGAGGGGDRGGT